MNREKFYFDNFGKHTNDLELNYTKDKGYQCIAKKEIKKGASNLLDLSVQKLQQKLHRKLQSETTNKTVKK